MPLSEMLAALILYAQIERTKAQCRLERLKSELHFSLLQRKVLHHIFPETSLKTVRISRKSKSIWHGDVLFRLKILEI